VSENYRSTPPWAYRCLLRGASWLAPHATRSEWRRYWEDGLRHWWALLADRGELGPDAHTRVLRYCRGAWADALERRFGKEILRRSVSAPVFPLCILGAFLIALGIASGSFPGVRELWVTIPYDRPSQLYTFSLADMLGQPYGVPNRFATLWREKSASIAGLTVYFSRGRHAEVAPNFFTLLGARPLLGRTIGAGDGSAAVLSYDFWREEFGGNRGVVGRDAVLEGRKMRITGVLPRDFWAPAHVVPYWTLLASNPPPMIGVIVRLAPGASAARARAELLAICRQGSLSYVGSRTRLLPLGQRARAPLAGSAVGLAFAMLIGAVMILARGIPFHGRGYGWRYWAFFLTKTVLALAALFSLWAEAANLVNLRIPGETGAILSTVLVNCVFFLSCGAMLYWCFDDQRRRCPVCLRRMALPVTIGSWGSTLFDPVSTEFLCDQGHGSLCVPETQSSSSELDRWKALDDSWRELFTK
jgi:hypothetical protein